MTDLDRYLAHYFLNEEQLSHAAGCSPDDLDALIGSGLVPAPSYVVSAPGIVESFVFGAMEAPGATPGRYFRPAQQVWIARARGVLASVPAYDAAARLKEMFCMNFATALATLNLSTWRLTDSFDNQGAPIDSGLGKRTDAAWTYFLNGTFTLCVAHPISEAHIAYKEVLQEKLTQQSDNGRKRDIASHEAQAMEMLIDAYAAAAMPFSPVEYGISSRKRLVEDLRAGMRVTKTI